MTLLLAALVSAGPVEDVFRSIVPKSAPDATAQVMAAAMTPEQKQAAREKLEPLPANIRAEGLRLLEDFAAAYRTEAHAQLPEPSSELTAAASVSLARGDNEEAARLAAEALARDPTDEKAFGILKLSERKVPTAALDGKTAYPHSGVAESRSAPTPKALALMQQAVEARRSGDLERTFTAALDAMRSDPTSPQVQQLYRMVTEDRAKHVLRARQTLSYLDQAAQAQARGNWELAVVWAEKAAASDPNPTTQRCAEEMRRKKLAASTNGGPQPTKPASRWPLFPLGAAGLSAGAYSLYRRRQTWNEHDSARAEDEQSNSERIRINRHYIKGAALAAGVFVATYWGPGLIVQVSPFIYSGYRAVRASFQRTAISQFGSINPPNRGIGAQAAAHELQMTQEFSALSAIGRDGRGPYVREVTGTLSDAQALFQRLSRFGQPAQTTRYSGKMLVLPNGARIGLRTASKSGPPTIDVHDFPGLPPRMKIKFIE